MQNLSRATKIPGEIYLMPKEHLHRFLEPIRSRDFCDGHCLLAAYLTYCSWWWVHSPYDFYKHFYVHFFPPDSNPTGNPKSGGTHSWWNEGKLGFFIPFPHHRHIRVIAENCGSDKPDKTFQWTRNVKGSMHITTQLHFLVICYVTAISWPHSVWKAVRLKYSNSLSKAISSWQIMTVHARGADTCNYVVFITFK